MKKLLTPTLAVAAIFSSTLALAGQHYNCATDTGCQSAQSKYDWGRDYTKTKYPLVFVHGLSGWTNAAGVDYYYGVANSLMRTGTTVTFAPLVSGQNSTQVRGEDLLAQLDAMKAVSGAEKFHFFGHDHGSPTIRYVHGLKPEAVASLTSVGGINTPSKVADDMLKAENNTAAAPLVKAFYKVFGFIGGTLAKLSAPSMQHPQRLDLAVRSLSTEGMTAFNNQFPAGAPAANCGEGAYEDVNGVKFYSFSGNRIITNVLDPLEFFVMATQHSFNEPNNGFVSLCESHFGKVIRDDYPINHMDEVNGVLGIRDITQVNPLSIYRSHVNRLKTAGL